MSQQPLIWALDLAAITGMATGRVDAKPVARSITLVPVDATSDQLFAACLDWFEDALERGPPPDILAIEALLPPLARFGATSTSSQHRLAGLHGIVRGLAHRAKVPEVMTASVADIRQHFIHHRNLKRNEAKRAVLNTCKMLGWSAADNNAGDALALWSYTAALLHPASALRTTPLFATWEDVADAREAKPRG